jgi:hypothetical protein
MKATKGTPSSGPGHLRGEAVPGKLCGYGAAAGCENQVIASGDTAGSIFRLAV